MPYKPHLKAWSYSRWSVYNACPFKAKCQYVEKLPLPPSPKADRGTNIHTALEENLKDSKKAIPNEFKFMKEVVDRFREKKAIAEEEFAYDRLWQPTGWFDANAWLRIKTDVGFWQSKDYRIVVDYKSGKEYSNHREQSDLYALSEFERFEINGVELVDVEFIYVDIPKLVRYEYDKSEHALLKKIWNKRGEIMTKDKTFKPKPGTHCKWCPFSSMAQGPCKY